jgi:hypothetical protein
VEHANAPKTAPCATSSGSCAAGKAASGPAPDLLALQRVLGNRALGRYVQASRRVSAPGDPLEAEADQAAEEVLQRKASCECDGTCESCAADDSEPVLRKAEGGTGSSSLAVPDRFTESLGAGRPLDSSMRSWFEPRFRHDFGSVRVHTDPAAAASAQAIDAVAYTAGRDIVFGDGQYAPGTASGQKLLAHELAHVIQQGGDGGKIQRTTHGPTTPTNCHNWKIPLPPWIAGTIAHGQISALLGIPSHNIPRASKVFMGVPNPPPIVPRGYADLWQNGGGVSVAEIKSTSIGDTIAHAEAAHYMIRHNEWLGRIPWTDPFDLFYNIDVGGPKAGLLLDLFPVTGTDRDLGPFWGDPLKNLHIEGDAAGAVLYWCTGVGLPGSPLWYPVFREVIRRLREALRRAQQTLEEVIDAVIEGGRAVARWVTSTIESIVAWGMANSRVLAFLLLLLILVVAAVILIISLLAEVPSGGTSTVPAIGSAVALAASAAGIMLLLGIGTPSRVQGSTETLAKAMNPDAADVSATGAEYEREAGGGSFPATQAEAAALRPDPQADFLAAINPLTDPVAVLSSLRTRVTAIPPGGIRQMQETADALESAGDAATAQRVRRWASSAGLA